MDVTRPGWPRVAGRFWCGRELVRGGENSNLTGATMKNTRTGCALMVLAWVLGNAALAGEPERKLPEKKVRIEETTYEIELLQVPAGKVDMPSHKEGDEPRTVQIKSIWVGKKEMEWPPYCHWAWARDIPGVEPPLKARAAKTRPSLPYERWESGWGTEGMPAMRMTCHAAELYCKWLSEKTGKKFRLPTEAEWEYVARAGGPPIENLSEAELDRVAWYGANSDDQTHPPGTKAPNAWGFYDTLGNVAEYVQNDDPKGVAFAKGGSWKNPAKWINTTKRLYWNAKWQARDQDPISIWWLSDGDFVGFRVVCED